ncbi:type II secretion system F family protein, partial [bacterium]|nr:type II secretion system F family protein [bacterium]
ISSNIPLVESLSALVDQVENVKLRKILTSIREKVTEGTKMSDALRMHGSTFSDLYINMVNAGESSGALDVVLGRLADFTESQARLKSKVIGALIYPAIMSIVGMTLMVMLLVFVVPKITSIFSDVNAVLPLPTRLLIGTSNVLSNYWYIVMILVGGGIYALKRYISTPKGREHWDTYMLKIPILGKILIMMTVARFARTLSTLLESGVPMLNAMDIVKNIIANSIIKNAVEKTKDSVREGESVAEPLKRSGLFPPMVIHMIAVGEKTGELERMLERVAETYDTQVDNTVSTLTSLLEPVMILVMAGAVAFVVMAILLPILQLNQLGV